MKALSWVIKYRTVRDRVSVFQNWSMAASYELARRRIPHDPRFVHLRPRLLKLLRHQQVRRLKPASHFGNHQLVEALEMLELARSGLRSDFRRAAIGPGRLRYLRLAERLINRRIPGMAGRQSVPVGDDRAFLLSDPPDEPMAYQGLSFGMYARALQLMGRSAGQVTPGVLRRVGEASWHLAAPDGDLGYMGRNNEEAWTLAATAFGAHEAALAPGTSRTRQARFQGLAFRALSRMVSAHLGGPDGLYIIPGLRQNFDRAKLAADGSASSSEFVGLTLVYLNLLADSPRRGAAPGHVAADADGVSILGRGESLRATVRHGDVWYATRAVPSAHYPHDLRYDPGLIVLKHRLANGSWHDVSPLRPRMPLTAPSDGAGPLLRTQGGRALLSARRIVPRPGGAVELMGAYRRLGSGRSIGRSDSAQIDPLGCGGAQVAFTGRQGDRLEYSVFLRDSGEGGGGVGIGPDSVTNAHTRVTYTPGASVTSQPGFVSATAPYVTRVRFEWTAKRQQRFVVGICDRG
jgi:hypothetical protein